MAKVSTRNARDYVYCMADFQTYGNLSGERVDGQLPMRDAGRLAGDDLERFRSDADRITYVVRSYATPIGWVADGVWYRVGQKFSVTTSKHQGNIPWTSTPA